MSKSETRVSSKDVFSVYQDNVDKLFAGVRQSVPQYHQSITNTQQEYLQACENIADSTIALQKEFVQQIGIAANVPELALKMIHDATEELVKAASIQNQIALASIDTVQQNIKTFNDNVKSFTNLNKNILQSWIAVFASKTN